MKKFINLFLVSVLAVLIFSCSNSLSESSIKITLPESISAAINSRAVALPSDTGADNDNDNQRFPSLCYYALQLSKANNSKSFKPVTVYAFGGDTVVFDEIPVGEYKIECVMSEIPVNEDLAAGEDIDVVELIKNEPEFYREAFTYFGETKVNVVKGVTPANIALNKEDFECSAYVFGYVEEDAYFQADWGATYNLNPEVIVYKVDSQGVRTKVSPEDYVISTDSGVAETNNPEVKNYYGVLNIQDLPYLDSKSKYEVIFNLYSDEIDTWYYKNGLVLSRKAVIEGFEDKEEPEEPEEYIPGDVDVEDTEEGVPVNKNENLLFMNHEFKGNEGISLLINNEKKQISEVLVREYAISVAEDSFGPYVPVYIAKGGEKIVAAYAAVSFAAPEVNFTYAVTKDETGSKESVPVSEDTEITIAQYTDKTELKVVFADKELKYSCYMAPGDEPVPTNVTNSGSISLCTWKNGSDSLGIQDIATSTFEPNTLGTYYITGEITHSVEVNGKNYCANNGKIKTPELTVTVTPWSIQVLDVDGSEVIDGTLEAGKNYNLNIVNESGSSFSNNSWSLASSVSNVSVSGQGTNGIISVSSNLAEQSAGTLLATYGGYTLAEVDLTFKVQEINIAPNAYVNSNTRLLRVNGQIDSSYDLIAYVDGSNSEVTEDVASYLEIQPDSFGPYVPILDSYSKSIVAYARVGINVPSLNFTYTSAGDNNTANSVVAGQTVQIAQYTDTRNLKVELDNKKVTYNYYKTLGAAPESVEIDVSKGTANYQWYKGTTSVSGATSNTYEMVSNYNGSYSYKCNVKYSYIIDGTDYCNSSKDSSTLSVNVNGWSINAATESGVGVSINTLSPNSNYIITITNTAGNASATTDNVVWKFMNQACTEEVDYGYTMINHGSYVTITTPDYASGGSNYVYVTAYCGSNRIMRYGINGLNAN